MNWHTWSERAVSDSFYQCCNQVFFQCSVGFWCFSQDQCCNRPKYGSHHLHASMSFVSSIHPHLQNAALKGDIHALFPIILFVEIHLDDWHMSATLSSWHSMQLRTSIVMLTKQSTKAKSLVSMQWNGKKAMHKDKSKDAKTYLRCFAVNNGHICYDFLFLCPWLLNTFHKFPWCSWFVLISMIVATISRIFGTTYNHNRVS